MIKYFSIKALSLVLLVTITGWCKTTPEEVYAEMIKISGQMELWPGFNPKGTPLAVYDGQKTWLFGHPKPPAGFVLLKPGVFTMDGRHEQITANTNIMLAEVGTATLGPENLLMSATGAASVALHEAFHVFQREKHKGWAANEATIVSYPAGNDELFSAKRLEYNALARAMTATTPEDRACWASIALNQRESRAARMSPPDILYERQTELNEGLSQYIQYRAAGSKPDLRETAAMQPGSFRKMCYDSGAAWAFLLDQFDADWRKKLDKEDGQFLDQMLAAVLTRREGCAFEPTEIQEITRTAKADTIYMRRELARIVRDLERGTGWRIYVKVLGKPLKATGFDPLNLELVNPKTVYHKRYLKAEGENGSLEMIDHEAFTISAGSHALFDGFADLKIFGLAGKPELSEKDGTVVVKGDGFTLNFTHADSAWHDNELRIIIR